jgi:hypothetical protein
MLIVNTARSSLAVLRLNTIEPASDGCALGLPVGDPSSFCDVQAGSEHTAAKKITATR